VHEENEKGEKENRGVQSQYNEFTNYQNCHVAGVGTWKTKKGSMHFAP